MQYKVTFTPSGHEVAVDESHNILSAGIAAGLGLPYSCKTGICRTCKGKVTSGTVRMGDIDPRYLSNDEREEGYALLCQAHAQSDLTIDIAERDIGGITPKIVPSRLIKKELLSHDVMLLRLKVPMNEKMRFLAGQYIEFILADDVRRSYSIANAPAPDGVAEVELHIRHLNGGLFTDRVFGSMKEKEILRFEGPFGSFYLREDSSKPIVMLASGTGFAPIKSMMEEAIRKNIPSTRPITIYWGCRTRADLYLPEVPANWAAAHSGITFIPVLSDATSECDWNGRTGFVHKAVMDDFPDLSGFEVYACGAPIMVDSARAEFISRCGLPEDAFFADSFITEAERHAPV